MNKIPLLSSDFVFAKLSRVTEGLTLCCASRAYFIKTLFMGGLVNFRHLSITLFLAFGLAPASFAAVCEYVMINNWGSGFTASIRITNDTNESVNGWQVSWQYTQGTVMTSSWNADITGSNPYTATALSWNSNISPGGMIEFGVQGDHGNPDTPEIPEVTGAVCNDSIVTPTPTDEPTPTPPPTVEPTATLEPTPTPTTGPTPTPTNVPTVTPTPVTQPPSVELQRVYPNLTFSLPLGIAQAPGDNSRTFVLEKGGVIYWVDANDNNTNQKNTYIDLSSVVDTESEGGLLGLAFHPNYQVNKQVFISMTLPSSSPMTSVIARYQENDNGTLNANSRSDLITLPQPYANHNGGGIAFSPVDGYLYVAFGDGGSANDPLNYGQDTSNFFGAMLRINVDSGTPYAVPSDNPFVNGGGLAEIYAYGLRNPWRWSFDRATGELWLADVGQDAYEEVNIIEAGGNYGWRCYEGFAVTSLSCNTSGPYEEPVAAFAHDEDSSSVNGSITGGYVYRGSEMPGMDGVYVFGDYVTGYIFGLTQPSPGVYERHTLLDTSHFISSFGELNDGELLVVSYLDGTLHKLAETGVATPTPTPTPTPDPTATPIPTATPDPTATPTPTPIPGNAALSCEVVVTGEWGSSYQLEVTVGNVSSAQVDSWSVDIIYSNDPGLTSHWNASITQTGNVLVAENVDWNASLAPGQETSFGVQGDFQGVNFEAPSCRQTGTGEVDGRTGEQLYSDLCANCHGSDAGGAPIGLPLNTERDIVEMKAYIAANMPAGNSGACGEDCADKIAEWLKATFWERTVVCENDSVNYGARQLKILTRSQYQNSVEDLVGIDFDISETLSADAKVGYFINNAHTSVVSSGYDQYLNAAKQIAEWSAQQDFVPAINCGGIFNQDCAASFVSQFAPKVFRRPLDAQEIATYTNMANGSLTEGDVKAGIEVAMQSLFSSPQFIYRHELGELNSNNSAIDSDAYELTSYEMATWLSYTLVGTTPDDIALQKAAQDQLRDTAAILVEAERLLESDKARVTLGDFVSNWLDTEHLENSPKDASVWADFASLVPHMKQEIREFFAYVMLNPDESFESIYNADFTFVNQTLANHYGINGVSGNDFVRVDTTERGGVLRNGAFMARWAEDVETSPVRRSVRVRRRMLCQNQPSPPAGVALGRQQALEENAELLNDPTTTNRLKYHTITSNEPCVTCHREWINPLGFGMEDFDAVGNPRTQDLNGNLIDASGQLYAPESLTDKDTFIDFQGSKGLTNLLVTLPGAQACVAENIFRFVVGAGTDGIDLSNPEGRALEEAERDGYTCEVRELTELMMSQSPRAMLESLGLMDAVRYRKTWSR